MKPLKEGQAEAFVDELNVLWLANGPRWITFADALLKDLEPFSNNLEGDDKAQLGLDLMDIFDPIERLEKFIRCRYSGSDNKPDIDADGTRNPEYTVCSVRAICPGCSKVCKKPKVFDGYLTFHECHIISIMATDIPDKMVAINQHLSVYTIHNIRRKAQRKLGVFSKYGIVREAVKLGLIK